MSKVTKNERISTLEDAVAMNWSDMKKIETKISRAMTDMAIRISNISLQLEGQQRQIHLAADSIGLNKQAIIMLENKAETKPQLKQLDQSVFDGLDEKWRFAVIQNNGFALICTKLPFVAFGGSSWDWNGYSDVVGKGYDTSNWQNSLIERDIAKELLEVDLSSELTGSDLAVKYFESNERHICFVGEDNDGCLSDLMIAMVVGYNEYRGFMTSYNDWFPFVTLINNQGEPLTQAEAGL